MKHLKNSLSVILCLSMALFMTACAAREPASPEDFKAAAQELELEVSELKAEDFGGIPEGQEGPSLAFIAESEGVHAELIEFSGTTSAKSIYANIAADMESEKPNFKKQVGTSTYSKLFIRSNDQYKALVRVDNSVFYGVETDGSGKLDQILEKLNYL